MPAIRAIVSGGQTGVDRGALDAAIELNIPHGGWCPVGRRAEDGVIPSHYAMRECDSPNYAVRTERNVLDSDATLIVTIGKPIGGTALTRRLAKQHAKPCLVVDLASPDAGQVRAWLDQHSVATLNVAGPRESQQPSIGQRARDFLIEVLGGDE